MKYNDPFGPLKWSISISGVSQENIKNCSFFLSLGQWHKNWDSLVRNVFLKIILILFQRGRYLKVQYILASPSRWTVMWDILTPTMPSRQRRKRQPGPRWSAQEVQRDMMISVRSTMKVECLWLLDRFAMYKIKLITCTMWIVIWNYLPWKTI